MGGLVELNVFIPVIKVGPEFCSIRCLSFRRYQSYQLDLVTVIVAVGGSRLTWVFLVDGDNTTLVTISTLYLSHGEGYLYLQHCSIDLAPLMLAAQGCMRLNVSSIPC